MSDDNEYTHDDNELSYDLPPMTATLHFNLETYEGERRLKECIDAPVVKSVMTEFDNWLRSLVKYGGVEQITVDAVRAQLTGIAESKGIDIWED